MINPSDPTSLNKDKNELSEDNNEETKNIEGVSEEENSNKLENKDSKTFLDFIKKVENKEVEDINELNEAEEEKEDENKDKKLHKKFKKNKDKDKEKKEEEEEEVNFIKENEKDKIEINLIPDNVSTIPVQINKMIKCGFIFGFSITIIFLVYLGIYLYGQSSEKRVEDIRAENTRLEQQYKSYKESLDDIKNTKQNLDEIIKLLDSHIYWTKFFNLLEENTIPEVFYYNFTGDTSGQMTLNAITDSYLSVSKQMIAFKNAENFVDSISVNDASANKLKIKKEETSNNEIQEEEGEEKMQTEEQNIIAFSVFLDLRDDVFLKIENNTSENNTITENLTEEEINSQDEENDDAAGENSVPSVNNEDTENNEENSYDLSDEEINDLLEDENLDEIANQIENELNQTQKED
ncbi:hypothetical protein K9M42_00050 [Patescibacteria group bacterium]|nr:hypothetical protein [Patescibacteria group bacterium]